MKIQKVAYVAILLHAHACVADVSSVIRNDDRYQCVRVADGAIVSTSARQDIVQAACAVAVENTRKPHDVKQPTLHFEYSAPVASPLVSFGPPTTGSAVLTWKPPTTNTDGSALTNLAGYVVRYGAAPGALSVSIPIQNPGTLSTTVSNLTPGTWYFAIAAVNSQGAESALSNIATKVIIDGK